jgi:hypothetical protein
LVVLALVLLGMRLRLAALLLAMPLTMLVTVRMSKT